MFGEKLPRLTAIARFCSNTSRLSPNCRLMPAHMTIAVSRSETGRKRRASFSRVRSIPGNHRRRCPDPARRILAAPFDFPADEAGMAEKDHPTEGIVMEPPGLSLPFVLVLARDRLGNGPLSGGPLTLVFVDIMERMGLHGRPVGLDPIDDLTDALFKTDLGAPVQFLRGPRTVE